MAGRKTEDEKAEVMPGWVGGWMDEWAVNVELSDERWRFYGTEGSCTWRYGRQLLTNAVQVRGREDFMYMTSLECD